MLVVFLKCQKIFSCLYLQFTVSLPVTLTESGDLGEQQLFCWEYPLGLKWEKEKGQR